MMATDMSTRQRTAISHNVAELFVFSYSYRSRISMFVDIVSDELVKLRRGSGGFDEWGEGCAAVMTVMWRIQQE